MKSKTKEAILRNVKDLENCPIGKELVLLFGNEDYTGIFQGIEDEEIILQSTTSENRIGLPFNRLTSYLERIK
jgi:hypothetical protein